MKRATAVKPTHTSLRVERLGMEVHFDAHAFLVRGTAEVCVTYSREVAEKIVNAINSHDELLAKNVEMSFRLANLLTAAKETQDSLVGATLHLEKFIKEKLLQAIAKAEGK